ncbi:MAG: T9SS type A sorting domain-containing protein [Saprospiraceae bacterium]|jgi:hypothetical protein|nr:T9SS type A sorting domain-containing protein [Saprospiraceae bacterium]
MCIRFLVSFFLFFSAGLSAQTVLLQEDFNGCALPAGWQVRITGSTFIPAWNIGFAQNSAVQGQSIDGTCMLFIDDDAGGATAPGYMLEFVSPVFDVSGYTTVMSSMDVYFRFGASDFMQIFVSDGSTETLLARFDNYTTNYEPLDKGDIFKIRHDLAFVTQSPTAHLIIRYTSPNGSKGNYAAIDNIEVVGSGTGTNVLLEDFDMCQKPAGWTTEIVSGPANWSFGFVPLGSSAFYEGNSMNGTCFAFFDDNAQGELAPGSTIRLRSPWFSGTEFFDYKLTYDAIMRYSGYESFAVYLENDKGETIPLTKTEGHVAGPFFPDYGSFAFDLSPYRSPQLRIVFEYSDGGKQGYWAGIDNVKVTGNGPALDFCDAAYPLLTGAPCTTADNTNALLTGPASTCSDRITGGLWFRWQANFTGIAKLSTRADFNDVVNVFTGSCGNPLPVVCDNRDEHGFTGETTFFPCQAGTHYFLRVAGQEGGFGLPRGQVCIGIEAASAYPVRPVNDDCATAQVLTINSACTPGNNRNAAMSAFLPSHNRLARADVWYRFAAPTLAPGQTLELETNADFSHIITLYRGACNSLTEIATNEQGALLTMPTLTAGQTYFVQIAGVFATVEGNLCPKLAIVQNPAPANDLCETATTVALNATCLPAGITGATFSGPKPACAVSVEHDVWFQFIAPEYGSVQVNTGAKFEHILAVWEGDCNNLKQVFCQDNPLSCEGYTIIPNLNKGQTYFLQIASRDGTAGSEAGEICLKIRDGALPYDFTPLELSATQLCVGADSVKLLATVSGGTPPYTFLTNTAGQIVSGGTPWSFVIQDAIGCQTWQADTAKTCLSNACTANIAITPTPPSCYDTTDGALSAAVLSGGTGPFFFEWSNQIYTANNAGLAPGTYSLTISENTGCTYLLETEVPKHDSLLVDILVHQPCYGTADGSLSAVVTGGNGGLLAFQWSNQVFSTENTNLGPGTYTLTVTEATGCSYTAEAELVSPDSLVYEVLLQTPDCFGDTDGALFAEVLFGGVPPFDFVWSNQVLSAENVNLGAGTYTLTITESSGCTSVAEVELTQPDSLIFELLAVEPTCFGDTDGSLEVALQSGGTGPFALVWSNEVYSAENPNLGAGTYTLTITDAKGCTQVVETILESPDSLYLILENLQHPEPGASNGSIHVTPAGGTPPIMYSWYLNTTTFVAATEDLEGVPAGTYILYAMDSHSCWDSLSRTLTETVATRQVSGEAFEVRVYPNPASEKITVSVHLPKPAQLDIRILDILSRTVLQEHMQQAAQTQFELDVRRLQPGVYLLHLQSANSRVIRRLVVSH